MKKLVLLQVLVVIGLVGCKADSVPARTASSQPEAVETAKVPNALTLTPPRPKYGWKAFRDETFETQAEQAKAFGVPARITRVRVAIEADSAVFGGMFTQAFLSANRRTLRSANFRNRPCSLMSVDKAEVTCALDGQEPMAFVVRDKRAEGSMLETLAGAKLHSRKMVERGVLPDKVHVSLSSWRCIENCRGVGG